jgi:hypothetical protein
MTKAQQTERIAGDPKHVFDMWTGKVAQPPLTTARAKWEWRQMRTLDCPQQRARLLLPIVQQFIFDIGEDCKALSLGELREIVAVVAEKGLNR